MAASTSLAQWYKYVLGSKLLPCGPVKDTPPEEVPIDTVFVGNNDLNVVGLYFTPVTAIEATTSISPKLLSLYNTINSISNTSTATSKNKLEIIQIIASESSFSSLPSDFTENCKRLTKLSPWFVIPVEEAHRKLWMCSRFGAKRYAPTLVLLEAKSGRVITRTGVEELETDSEGKNFPWRPRSAFDVLKSATLTANKRQDVSFPEHAIVGIYFSAKWCGACRAFTPVLMETYKKVKERGHAFEIIFVSLDSSEDGFKQNLSSMPWLATRYGDENTQKDLKAIFNVKGIPLLGLLNPEGQIIKNDVYSDVQEDPEGLEFPWYPKLVNDLSHKFVNKICENPCLIMFVESNESRTLTEKVLLPVAEYYKEKYHPDEDVYGLQFFIACHSDVNEYIWLLIGLEEKVPQLAVLDTINGKMSYTDKQENMTVEFLKSFVTKFMEGTLDLKVIESDQFRNEFLGY